MLKDQYSLNRDFEKFIVSEYLSGKPSTQVALENDLSWKTVILAVRKSGGKVRTSGESKTKYFFNHQFFKKIDSAEKAYFLGLMLADGYVGKKEIIISLNYIDHHILKKFVEAIEGNNKVHVNSKTSGFNKNEIKQVSRLSIRSDEMILDLNKLGLTRNKTLNIIVPKIEENLEKHFWRGVLDGDGYVSIVNHKGKVISAGGEIKFNPYKYIEVGICGHINTIEAFSVFLTKNGFKVGKISPDKSIFRVRICGKNAVKFLDFIYKDCPDGLFLTRKYQKYQDYLQYLKEKAVNI